MHGFGRRSGPQTWLHRSGGRHLQDFHLIGQRWTGRLSATAQVQDENPGVALKYAASGSTGEKSPGT